MVEWLHTTFPSPDMVNLLNKILYSFSTFHVMQYSMTKLIEWYITIIAIHFTECYDSENGFKFDKEILKLKNISSSPGKGQTSNFKCTISQYLYLWLKTQSPLLLEDMLAKSGLQLKSFCKGAAYLSVCDASQ